MPTLVKVTLLTISVGLTAGCLRSPVDDNTGLCALRGPLVDHGREVQRVGDPALVSSFRVLAATWDAAVGR